MEKIAVAGDLADVVDLNDPIEATLEHIAKARGVAVPELTVCILDRPRHDDLVRRIREAGSRIKFLLDGDVAGSIMAASPDTNVDLMVGIGGTPEGVLAACALKCLGGAFYGRLYPRDDDERRRALDAGYDLDKILTLDDMVSSNNVFVAASGVTDGELLRGVSFSADRATTHSLSMRSKSGAVRLIETRHRISTSNLVTQ
jgi:fructose-1,6-bisphosphatase II